MTMRRSLLVLPAALLGLLGPLLAACGEDTTTAGDPPSDDPAAMPTEAPASPGEVRTRGDVTVMDTGKPEVCLGAVAESWPPQCGGPALVDWSWEEHPGEFTQQGTVRWGSFALRGTWDGEALTVTEAVAVDHLDGPVGPYGATTATPASPAAPVAPVADLAPPELERIAQEVDDLPGSLGAAYADVEAGTVRVDVAYDDGSLQAWADEAYGDGVVEVVSALVDV